MARIMPNERSISDSFYHEEHEEHERKNAFLLGSSCSLCSSWFIIVGMYQQKTVTQILARAALALTPASATPRLDAELLLAHVLGWTRARLLAAGREALTPEQQATFGALVARRQNLEPVAYITGYREFYGLEFEVTPATLVPRPETELLVDLALQHVRQRTTGNKQPLRVADIGTGTGCIAVGFAVNYPQARIVAVDLSPAALAVARRNVARHGLAERVMLLEGDLLAPLTVPIDLLLSNPPYVVMDEIDENVRRHEPHLALDGGAGGLEVYRRLLAQAPAKLAVGGTIMVEIGAWQGAAVAELGGSHFPYACIAIHQDLAGHDRVVVIEQPV